MAEVSQQDLIDTINGVEPEPVNTPQNTDQPPVNGDQPNPAPVPEPDKSNPAPTFNLDEELAKLSNGEIKTKDELAAILGRAKEYDSLEAKFKTYESENTDLKAKVSVDPFANDFSRKLNEFYKVGADQHVIDAFMRINRVENIDDLSPLEARKLELQIKEGLTPEEASQYIDGTYKLKAEDEENPSDLQKAKHEEIRLKVDSNASKEFLKTHKAQASQIPTDPTVAKAQEQESLKAKHVESLLPFAKNVSQQIAFKDINVNGKDGEAAFKMDFNLSDESKASLEPALVDYISKNGMNIPNTQEGVDHLKTVAENILVLQNWKRWIADATNTREKSVREEYHNPSSVNRGKDNPNPGKTSVEELGDWLLQNS